MDDCVDTRLPPGTVLDRDLYSAVVDPLNARNDRELWGFTDDEYAAMTRGQQAVFNLRWLRDYPEADTFLEYANEPALRRHADRLVEDAALIGAHWRSTALCFSILRTTSGAMPEEFIGPRGRPM